MEKNLSDIFTDVKKDLLSYVDLRLKLLKLEAIEKTGKISATLSFVLGILFIVFFSVLFLFLGLGYYLGEIMHSQALGMVAIGILYMILLAIVLLNKKKIMNKVFSVFISELTEEEEENNG